MAASQSDMFSLMGAKEARDLGITRVEGNAHDWIALGLARIAGLPRGYEGIGEEICQRCQLPPAPSSGAVGALIRRAREKGYLAHTGRMKQPRCVKSHARATYIWRRT
jgi:hypothetical protein